MGQVSASSTVLIDAEPATVLGAVADYQAMRPKILSSHYSGYQVLEGGQGAGTVAGWKLQATKSRSREVLAHVDVAGHTVIEKDANSSMVTNWTVAPAGPGTSVTVKTSWQGAGGIGGFFEKTFAPIGLALIPPLVLLAAGRIRRETFVLWSTVVLFGSNAFFGLAFFEALYGGKWMQIPVLTASLLGTVGVLVTSVLFEYLSAERGFWPSVVRLLRSPLAGQLR